MAGLTLDAGALIAADRDDRSFWIRWKRAIDMGVDVTVPAPVLAEAWRGRRNVRMARALSACVVDPLTEAEARMAGELCAAVPRADAVDACLVAGAVRRGDAILTNDTRDIGALVDAAGARCPVLAI